MNYNFKFMFFELLYQNHPFKTTSEKCVFGGIKRGKPNKEKIKKINEQYKKIIEIQLTYCCGSDAMI